MKIPLVLSGFLFFAVSCLNAEYNSPKIGLGINYIGGQARYHLDSRWAGELRYLTGSEDAATGKVASQVFGLRAYRFFREATRYRFFLGAEAALVNSNQKNTSYKVSGPAMGVFGGLEYRFGRRFALGFDMGPYVISLKEDTKNVSDSSLEFIANTALIFYLF